MNQTGEASTGAIVVTAIFGVILLVVILMIGLPLYGVWQQGLKGEAALNRSTQERQILVEQARAERDAAQLTADAIAIVGQAAKDFPEYRQQEFIRAFGEAVKDHAVNTVIYVPTEGNIPVTEAGRFLRGEQQ